MNAKLLNAITENADSLAYNIKYYANRIKELQEYGDKIYTDDLPENAYVCWTSYNIEISGLKHDEIMRIISRLGIGKWIKRTEDATMLYRSESPLYDEVHVVLTGEPPASCKVVYEEITVPATTRRVAKILCKPDGETLES